MHVELYCPKDLEELLDRSRKQRNAKQRDRYRVVLLALKGQTTACLIAVAEWTPLWRNLPGCVAASDALEH